jgi:hypothetical protein
LHGLIFAELRKFTEANLGPGSWKALTDSAGLGQKSYLSTQVYPDSDVFALVSAASQTTGLPAQDLLEAFGMFIAPDLIGMFRTLLDPQWRTLDVIEHTETTIHKVVRTGHPGAQPPELQTIRRGDNEVTILYRSNRKLCSIAKGICNGLAKHFAETIAIEEPTCMLLGGAQCTIVVRRT